MWIFSSVHSLFLPLSFQYKYISMLHYIYVKSLLLLFKYYSLLNNVLCYKYVSFLVLFSIQFIIKSLFHLCIFSIYLFLLPFTTLKRPSTIALHVVITWWDNLQFWCFSCQFSSWSPTSFCSNMDCSALVLLHRLAWKFSSLAFWNLFCT